MVVSIQGTWIVWIYLFLIRKTIMNKVPFGKHHKETGYGRQHTKDYEALLHIQNNVFLLLVTSPEMKTDQRQIGAGICL